ncbi:NEDD8-activating enzyme E1 regulatory subunit APP-BP1 [Takifugu flavidus]|uniref:NEDD8-activating enzyme E1 regulatory subunit n=1 Tax=Takifugu flavidus TaxID=433684 RepID=A0A5C6NMR6_9TELE|nr:NEDD8-activating enzyme E1 regulatory subunit APP-BP1 [Takifugu flavidus]
MAATKASKEQKYDRQLRLWGDHGQESLENSHVCLINATATGTEILKNLVLPGIGAFTIVDGHVVTGEDVGNNFFLSNSSIGKSPDKLLDNDPEFFHRFSIVIGVQLPESTFLRLGTVLWSASVPFLICKTYGLIGYMRLVVQEHTVIESHPDNALEDLRLDQPFAELKDHVKSYDLDNMDKKDHSHTPWIIIVAKYLEKWLSEHNCQPPKNYKEKEAFRQFIREGIRKNENGVPEDEENFEEAIKSVNTALTPTKIPSVVKDLFNSEQCNNVTSQTPSFWLMLQAVKEFVLNEGNGSLPVRGTIPDMIADSQKFIKLQNVYRTKAMQDAAAVSKYVERLLQSVGKPPESIPEQDIKLFCKNSSFLRVVHCRSLADEYSVDTVNRDEITSCMDNPDSEMVFYLMLRSIDRFYQQHSHFPGVYNYQVEEDIIKLKLCVNSLLQEYNLNVNIKDDYIHEFCRYGAAEPHMVASFLGGSAAQEAIKIISHQFVPFSNTFIYSAMSQTSATFQL